MKIAFITDDGKSISQHFGRARYYYVVEVEDGIVKHSETRDKMGHNHFSGEEHHHHEGQGSGMDAASHDKHHRMSQAIQDCEVLICGGMGMGAYQSMQTFGITPVVTQIRDIDAALQAYLSGELKDETQLLH